MTSVGGESARLVGRTLDVYQLRSLLGAGGMAEVYRALETPLGREVAVKVLPDTLARDPGYVERFRSEARQVAALNHPHITPVYHYGEEQGLLFLVMPLLKESLRDRLDREGRLDPKDATRLTVQIASALDAAHARGLVHRDVKPENILLNADGKAMLTDFGIAREVAFLRATGAARTLAASGLPVGTPEYMAPEQLRAALVDQRADLYALGAVLYELLTGVVPHEAATPYEVAALALTAPIAPPSSHNHAIWPELDGVILKALEKEPDDRYQTARSFAQALRESVVGQGHINTTAIPSVRWTQYAPPQFPQPPQSPQSPQSGALRGPASNPGASGNRPRPAISAAPNTSGARNPMPARPPFAEALAPLPLPDDEETQPSLPVSGKHAVVPVGAGAIGAIGLSALADPDAITLGIPGGAGGAGGAGGGFGEAAHGGGSGRGRGWSSGWSRRRGFWLLLSAGALLAVTVGVLGAAMLGGFNPFATGFGSPSVGQPGALATSTATTHPRATSTRSPTPTHQPTATPTTQPTATPTGPAQLAFSPTTLNMTAGRHSVCTGTISVANNGPGVSNWSWSQISPFTPIGLRYRIDSNGSTGSWTNGAPQDTQQPNTQENIDIHFNCYWDQDYTVMVISNSSGGQSTYTLTLSVSTASTNNGD